MIYFTGQFTMFLGGASVMLVLLGLVTAVIAPTNDEFSKKIFIAHFTLLLIYSLFGVVDVQMEGIPELRHVQEIVYYFETLFTSLLMPLLMVFLLHSTGQDWKKSPVFHLEMILWGLFFLMLNITPFAPLFYYLTEENLFARGPLYPLLILDVGVMLAVILICTFRWKDRMSKRYYIAFLIAIIPMMIGVLIHLFTSVFILFGIGLALCAFSMFCIILFDQVEHYLTQQREIARQRASIMILQMRPHFIYNTMMSIYYLCKQNPDLAQQVTLDFTTYLRKNFTAIASEELIPFDDELEHTRAYLAVEQAQFEDHLFVDYDMTYTDFRVPALTLQPIVENAVKHGMDPDSEPLHIVIRTSRTDTGCEIIVENSGSDFEPANDNEPHIALKNIEQRIGMMCHGKMVITPREGGGTVVRVTIPDAYAH